VDPPLVDFKSLPSLVHFINNIELELGIFELINFFPSTKVLEVNEKNIKRKKKRKRLKNETKLSNSRIFLKVYIKGQRQK
jgi:hypothetical protein